MFSKVAILVYLFAAGIPAWLLYRCGSQPWYWHVLATLCGLALGLLPLPPAWSQFASGLMFGFVFVFLMVWGIGGLFMLRPHHPKHA
jgi:hypothetical protein